MNGSNEPLERLLRSAAQADEEAAPAAPPFGFETRVVSLWRSGSGNNGNGVSRLLRRVALVSAAVLVISGVAAVRELRSAKYMGDATTNEYAIADNAIQTEFSP